MLAFQPPYPPGGEWALPCGRARGAYPLQSWHRAARGLAPVQRQRWILGQGRQRSARLLRHVLARDADVEELPLDAADAPEPAFDDAFRRRRAPFRARAWPRAVRPAWVIPLAWAARRVYRAWRDCTFWIGADAEPRTLLERFALDTFWAHAEAAGYSREDVARWGRRAGAEWWVQRRTAGQPLEERGVDWHYDQDQELYSKCGLLVSPFLATVTYLSDCGAPTVCLGQPTVPQASYGSSMEGLGPGTDAEAFISHPAAGKQLAFDGRLLHGCPSAVGHREGERLSLLVNLWLGHRPLDITRGRIGGMGGYAKPGWRHCPELLSLDAPSDWEEPDGSGMTSQALEVEVGPWRLEGVKVPSGKGAARGLSRVCFGRGNLRAINTE